MVKRTKKNDRAALKTEPAVDASRLMKNKYKYLIVILLIIASFAAFGRIAGNDFINFDDQGYITENLQIKSGINPKTIQWAFSTVVMSNWHPLTWLSHTLDWSLFGADASGHHIVSLLFHIGAVIFLFLFLNKTTNNIWPSAFAAALFALHPLRVESVAWAAERKDVLSMFFGTAALYSYALYAESSRLSRYFLCLILFALSLMSKPMLVTLPFALLLLDCWPLGRWQKVLSAPAESRYQFAGRLLWEKAPFFLLTIASSIITFWAQKEAGAVAAEASRPYVTRAANAVVSYVAYLGRTFWPVNLSVFYPYELSLPLWEILISGVIIIVITALVIYHFKKLPFLFVGWFWYLGTLIPVIGLVAVGRQGMADRYMYLPSIGIAVMLSWGIPLLFSRENLRKKILFPVGVTVILIMIFLTWQQCGYWKDSGILFNHAAHVTKDNDLAYNGLGDYYGKLGEYQSAIENFNEVIRLKPDSFRAFNGLGSCYESLGQFQLAFENFNKAIVLKPDYTEAYNNRGIAFFLQGKNEQGCPDARKACELGDCKLLELAKGQGDCR